MDPSFRSIRNRIGIESVTVGVALLLTLSSLPLGAAPSKEIVKAVQPTFLRHPLSADVNRGGVVAIPVEVIALPGQTVDLEIVTAPRFGTLRLLRGDAANSLTLEYRNDSRKKVGEDEFVIRIRAEGRSWSTRTGSVRIHDHPAILMSLPGNLDFGELPGGSSKSLSLILSNSSGDDAVASLILPPSCSLVGESSFSIPEGGRKEFVITFSPDKPGDYSGSVNFSPAIASLSPIPLKGRSLPPFVISEDRFEASAERPGIAVTVSNPASSPIRIAVSPDQELKAPESFEVPPVGSCTLSIGTDGVAVPIESGRVLHAVLSSGSYRKSLEIRVRGKEGRVVAEIPAEVRSLQASTSSPVLLSARLVNESRSPRPVEWKFQGEGTVVNVPASGSATLQGGETRDLSFLWQPAKAGQLSPRLVITPGDPSVGTASWEVICRSQRTATELPPAKNRALLPSSDLTGGDDRTPIRFPTVPERERMAILHSPVLEGSIYPRYLILPWSYQGTAKTGFVIEERSALSGMTDRSGEFDEGWKAIQPTYVATGSQCSWAVRLPAFLPGTREFRIYPAGEGERVLASETIPLTAEMVFGPLVKVLSIAGVILLSVLLLRMRVNRRSGG
jgi:hypothetical protein